ncbi:3-dehydroquinate synthase [Paenibacillus shirakamiensis]|uniref:3-dehydroquinate synthase n=1 Tax=Paenibacillus shirakamiensis TaxID=1265935 RepID=A0ABS4JG33_9BACL|nr:3-dehydroquinate synthase [Paenibacillus shirakamiensis]MBP1999544.1 3-dehydroquinate synthase [Paenibacillus shirakamiensis]
MRTLTVDLGERSYPIIIGRGLLNTAAEYLLQQSISNQSSLLLVTDDQVASLHLAPVLKSLEEAGFSVTVSIVKSGEQSKSLAVFEEVMTKAIEAGLDRNSAVLALGGGVVGDLAGFVAATYMRGIRFVQLPTTILAHDSSVGGKVAVNHPLAKNMIGAFHQPELVLYDVDTLKTLPDREVRAGYSEMIKHGLIWDASFAAWCLAHVTELLELQPEALAYGLEQGCAVKAMVVSQDERENGLRAILNLGHTIGHAIEAVAGYGEYVHGEAIAIGMIGSALIAVARGRDIQVYEDTRRLLKAFGLPVSLSPHVDTEQLIGALLHDKKFKNNKIVFVLPITVGQVEIVSDISLDEVRNAIGQLKREAI